VAWRTNPYRVLLPPSHREVLGGAETRHFFRIKQATTASAIVIDLIILATLRGRPSINQTALQAFEVINLSLLVLDFVIGLVAMRFARTHAAWQWAIGESAVIFAFTITVWIQLTGSISSYFVIGALILIMFFRMAYDYWMGLLPAAAMMVFHGAAVVLERIGVLRPESLFIAPPSSVYQTPELAIGIMCSVLIMYVTAFGSACAVINRFREQDQELAAARQTQQANRGRYSGRTFALRYEMGDLLGRGGMGEIYRARRLEDGVEVAIKVLHPHLCAEPTALERFQREAEAAARVGGTRTARVFETGTAGTGGTEPFIVMELLQGRDLARRLREEPALTTGESLRLVDEMAAALAAAHGAGIVHRDLKPQNVFLSEDGRVVLLDFGVSKMKAMGTTLTADADLLGSPGYMAPEQARGHVDAIGPATDVFALGAIAYRMLTGRPAFTAADVVTALFQVCNDEPMPPTKVQADLPPAVDEVLGRALAKRPEDRFASAQDFAAALRMAISEPRAAMMQNRGGRSR
jgi:hypothetical protein